MHYNSWSLCSLLILSMWYGRYSVHLNDRLRHGLLTYKWCSLSPRDVNHPSAFAVPPSFHTWQRSKNFDVCGEWLPCLFFMFTTARYLCLLTQFAREYNNFLKTFIFYTQLIFWKSIPLLSNPQKAIISPSPQLSWVFWIKPIMKECCYMVPMPVAARAIFTVLILYSLIFIIVSIAKQAGTGSNFFYATSKSSARVNFNGWFHLSPSRLFRDIWFYRHACLWDHRSFCCSLVRLDGIVFHHQGKISLTEETSKIWDEWMDY